MSQLEVSKATRGGKLSFKNKIIGHLQRTSFSKAYKQGILGVNMEYAFLISTKLFQLKL